MLAASGGARKKKKIYDILSLKNKAKVMDDMDNSRVPMQHELNRNSEDEGEEKDEDEGQNEPDNEGAIEIERHAEEIQVFSSRVEENKEEEKDSSELNKKMTLTNVQNLD